MFINVGCRWKTSGDRIPTKKALREAVAADPGQVVFDKTSLLDQSGLANRIEATDITGGVKLTVVGPDPYNKRSWYATVERKPDGSIKVS